MSKIYGRRSSSLHANVRTAGRVVLFMLTGTVLCVAAVVVLCTAEYLVEPATAEEATRG